MFVAQSCCNGLTNCHEIYDYDLGFFLSSYNFSIIFFLFTIYLIPFQLISLFIPTFLKECKVNLKPEKTHDNSF